MRGTESRCRWCMTYAISSNLLKDGTSCCLRGFSTAPDPSQAVEGTPRSRAPSADATHRSARRPGSPEAPNLTFARPRRMCRKCTPKTPSGVAGDPRRESPRTGANCWSPQGRKRIEQLQARARQLPSAACGGLPCCCAGHSDGASAIAFLRSIARRRLPISADAVPASWDRFSGFSARITRIHRPGMSATSRSVRCSGKAATTASKKAQRLQAALGCWRLRT